MGLVSRPRWVRRQTRVDVDVDVDVVAGQGSRAEAQAPQQQREHSTETYLRGKGTNEQKPGTTQIEHQSMHKNEGVSCSC